jgi:hypothetical protein
MIVWGLRAALAVAAVMVGLGGTTAAGPSVTDFLSRHWWRPLAPQGPAPPRFSSLERSLAPESCGSCHPAQFADWKSSFHAGSMGPGVTGQLIEMWRSDPDSARLCLSCHAPLAEQTPGTPAFDAGLQARGVVCAACHVRRHDRFGPPRRDGSLDSGVPRETLPHNGVVRTPAFHASEFCSSCHQFAADGFALNGKLLENTYSEWKTSAAAREGRQCQDCHMPDRRHLWRGIHDRDMVASGVRVSFDTGRPRYSPGDEVRATLIVSSVSVGHFLPTYVTPRLLVRLALTDTSDRELSESVDEHSIGRDVSLDLSRELRDTRIPPGGRARFVYSRKIDRPGLHLVATVTVEPDYFYTRFFESLLKTGAGRGTADIHAALQASRRSSFQIFKRTIPLT